MSSRSVKFRRSSPSGGSHYDHQRSDSGVGSFSDSESRASNPDHDYIAPGYDDPRSIYSLQLALDQARQERDDWIAKATALEENLTLVHNEFAQHKAHVRAITNEKEILAQEKEILAQEKERLTKSNKELAEENAQLQESAKELKKASRKSSSNSSPSVSTVTPSESSDEKKLRRSSSKRHKESSGRADKEKEREKERERELKERERERRKAQEKALERAEKEETERLRKRFDARGDESDTKGSSVSAKTQRNRRDSYIEPLGHGAPRPSVATVPPSPARQYAAYSSTATVPAYGSATGYASIREPFKGATPRPHHPSVYIADEYTAPYGPEYAAEEDDPYHVQPVSRSARHPR